MLLNPPEGERPTKTGDWDHSVMLDSVWLNFLGPALERLKVKARPGRPVWHFEYPEYLRCFRQVAESEGISKPTLYQTRHSGASIDRFYGWRSLTAVKKRGGWRSDRSVARYEKSARLGVQKERRCEELIAHGRRCVEALADILLHGRALPSHRPGARR